MRAVAGATYNIVIGTPGPPLESEIRLYWSPGPPSGTPANDDVAKAQVLSGSNGAVAGRLANGTSEVGEQHGYETGGVWYRWTAAATGRITWHTAPTDSSQHITFYRGGGSLRRAHEARRERQPPERPPGRKGRRRRGRRDDLLDPGVAAERG